MASNDRPDESSARRAERHALEASARLKPNSWSSLEVEMLDLSRSGFRARCEARVRPGSGVTLDIAGIGEVDAQVEWQRDGEFGARFITEIDLDRCSWTLSDGQQALARLLVARAAAKQVGRSVAEQQLRRQILAALPIRRGVSQA